MIGGLARRMLRRTGLNDRINRTQGLTVGGRRFRVPVLGGLKAYASEDWLIEVLRRLMSLRDGAFVDVGVNLGQTLLKVAAIDPARDYLGFEPNPTCVAYLGRLIAANGLSQCRVLPVGLSSGTGILRLSVYGNDADSSASLVPGFRPGKRASAEKFVPVFTLGDLPSDLIPDRVAIVKIDVEGAELAVTQALSPLLASQRPFMVMEVLPCYSPEYADRIARQAGLENLLAELRYDVLRIERDSAQRLTRLRTLDSIGIHDDLDLCDYVMSPREETPRVLDAFAALHG
jgi:FkbM family methyltransferase